MVSALQGGVWTARALTEHLAANLTGIKSAYSVTCYRLTDLPDTPPAVAPARPERPPWCGTCDEHTRQQETTDGRGLYSCPACHPLSSTTHQITEHGQTDRLPASSTTRAAAKATITATLKDRSRRRQGSLHIS